LGRGSKRGTKKNLGKRKKKKRLQKGARERLSAKKCLGYLVSTKLGSVLVKRVGGGIVHLLRRGTERGRPDSRELKRCFPRKPRRVSSSQVI